MTKSAPRLLETIGEISDEQATALPDGEKWTIAQTRRTYLDCRGRNGQNFRQTFK